MSERIDLAELRKEAEAHRDNDAGWREHGDRFNRIGEQMLALIDIAEAAHNVDLSACIHGITWAESEGAADNTEVRIHLETLEKALARIDFVEPA